ncbi:hypothetical protein EF384_08475 [Aerococcus agrisoli]|uniref:Cell wall-active antibiotics response LiaF-like C-terminal domain-containing protein n=1 Tax=Aerococcus agrisoli TaxID=2487350 RepID=A0A3N4G3U8_9LACT|nr:hypothetical protein EF384_08475 [Aerococcus agrisoli]
MKNRYLIFACFAALIVITGLFSLPQNIFWFALGCLLLAIAERVKLHEQQNNQNRRLENMLLVLTGCFFIFMSIITLKYVSGIIVTLVAIALFYYTFVKTQDHKELDKLVVRQTKIVAPEEGKKDDKPFMQFEELFNKDRFGETTYAWEDTEMYYLYANSFIDFGSTIVPLGTNVVVINQVFGQTKLIVPEGVGLSLHANGFRSEVSWNGDISVLNNERRNFQTEEYVNANRKIYLQISQGWGRIEVIFL